MWAQSHLLTYSPYRAVGSFSTNVWGSRSLLGPPATAQLQAIRHISHPYYFFSRLSSCCSRDEGHCRASCQAPVQLCRAVPEVSLWSLIYQSPPAASPQPCGLSCWCPALARLVSSLVLVSVTCLYRVGWGIVFTELNTNQKYCKHLLVKNPNTLQVS